MLRIFVFCGLVFYTQSVMSSSLLQEILDFEEKKGQSLLERIPTVKSKTLTLSPSMRSKESSVYAYPFFEEHKSQPLPLPSSIKPPSSQKKQKKQKMTLKEQLLHHQEGVRHVFDLQEDRLVELEQEVMSLKNALAEKDALLEEKEAQILKLEGQIDDLRQENQNLMQQVSEKSLSLKEALLQGAEIQGKMDKQKKQIQIIQKAANALKKL